MVLVNNQLCSKHYDANFESNMIRERNSLCQTHLQKQKINICWPKEWYICQCDFPVVDQLSPRDENMTILP